MIIMEENGISIFQGPESLDICGLEQRRQEEEDQEETERRKEEIHNALQNVFYDLENENDNDESSMNSSYHHRSSFLSTSPNNTNNYTDFNERHSIHNGIQNELGPYDRRPSTETVIEPSSRTNVQNGFDHRPQINTPSDKIQLGHMNHSDNVHEQSSSDSNKENSCFNYPCNIQTPSNHFSGGKDFARKNCFNGVFDISDNHINLRNYGNESQKPIDQTDHYRTNTNISEEIYKNSELHSKEQLEVLNMVRLREIEGLNKDIRQLQLEREKEKTQLERRLAIAQAEVEKSNISRNQLQNNLVDAKAEIADLKSQITLLNETNAVLEKTKENIIEELSTARNTMLEMQQKITTLEKIQINQSNDKFQEKLLQQIHEKHNTELRNMQSQIDILTNKLSTKERAYDSLEQKYSDAVRANESLLIQKGETINKLAKTLEESQSQCRNLMSNNYAEEVRKLEETLRTVLKEKDELIVSNKELEHKLKLSYSDSYLIGSRNQEPDIDALRSFDFNNTPLTSKYSEDMTNKLHAELQKCLAGQSVKRKEINRLENIIAQKEKELQDAQNSIYNLEQDKSNLLKKVERLEKELKILLTDQAMKANDRIKKLADHLTEVKEKYEELKIIKESLEKQLELHNDIKQSVFTQTDLNMIKDENSISAIEFYQNTNSLMKEDVSDKDTQIIELTIKLEQSQKELDRVKKLYIDVCEAKAKLTDQYNTEIGALRNCKAEELTPEFGELNKRFSDQTSKLKSLIKDCEVLKSEKEHLKKSLEIEIGKNKNLSVKIHTEIDKAKRDAIEHFKNIKSDNFICLNCAKHLKKISQLEAECKKMTDDSNKCKDKLDLLHKIINQMEEAKKVINQIENIDHSSKEKIMKILSRTSKFEQVHFSDYNKKLIDLQESKIKYLEQEIVQLKQKENNFQKIIEEKDAINHKLKKQGKDNYKIVLQDLDESDLKRLKEVTVKEIKNEMEEKITEELRTIDSQYKEKLKQSQMKSEYLIMQWKTKYEDLEKEYKNFKDSEAERAKSHYTIKEQMIAKRIETKMRNFQEEIVLRKLQIEELQKMLYQKHADMEEERNDIAQLMSQWVAEIEEMKTKNSELKSDIKLLSEQKEVYLKEIESLKGIISALKKKYQSLKKVALSYKDYAKRKEDHYYNEVKRIEEDNKKSKHQAKMKVSNVKGEVTKKIEEIRNQIDQRPTKIISHKK